MPDHEFGEGLAVKENAMPAISQIREQLADAVIAIVDHTVERLVMKGTAASAGLSGGFVQRDRAPGTDDLNSAGKPRHARADNMDHRHHCLR